LRSLGSKLKKSFDSIERYLGFLPKANIGLILGSGLGELADEVEESLVIPYEKVEGFLKPTVKGHKGNLVFGKLGNKNVCIMQGRFHYYEGNSVEDIVYPIHVIKELGVSSLIVTNAAGGINLSFRPGDLVIIKDYINFAMKNPSTSLKDVKPVIFKDINWIKRITRKFEGLKEGVYIFVTGPSYETPSEIKMFRKLGADMVGMSTVPEIITANSIGIKVLGFSCITNMAAGILEKPLSHQEVIEVSKMVKEKFKKLIKISIMEA